VPQCSPEGERQKNAFEFALIGIRFFCVPIIHHKF
jgi:hypothetical protein